MFRPVIARPHVPRRAFSTTSLNCHPSCLSGRQVLPIPSLANAVPSCCPRQIRRKSTEVQLPHWIKPGDWVCGNCQAHNFRSRTLCFVCQKPINDGRIFYRKGDWHCPKCNVAVASPNPSLFEFSYGKTPPIIVTNV